MGAGKSEKEESQGIGKKRNEKEDEENTISRPLINKGKTFNLTSEKLDGFKEGFE